MRQIEFRGLRTDGKGWVYGCYHYSADNKNHYILAKEPFLNRHRDELALHLSEVSEVRPETVGQFTGLHDKDGNKIFEGDIISFESAYTYFIVYDGGAFHVYHTSLDDENGGKLRWGLLSNVASTFPARSIIGNIHESPELINQK